MCTHRIPLTKIVNSDIVLVNPFGRCSILAPKGPFYVGVIVRVRVIANIFARVLRGVIISFSTSGESSLLLSKKLKEEIDRELDQQIEEAAAKVQTRRLMCSLVAPETQTQISQTDRNLGDSQREI